MKSLSTHIMSDVKNAVQYQGYGQISFDVMCRIDYIQWKIDGIVQPPICGQIRKELAERLSYENI